MGPPTSTRQPCDPTRDLLRRRTRLVRTRAEALAHIQNTLSQCNLPPIGKKLGFAANRVVGGPRNAAWLNPCRANGVDRRRPALA